jgi:hypothetical protein
LKGLPRMGFDYDFDDNPPEQTDDLAAQLEQARAAHADAEKRLAELKKRHAEAGSGPAAGQAAAGPGEANLDELAVLIGDRSRSWPDVLADLENRGFRSSASQPSRHGIRQA